MVAESIDLREAGKRNITGLIAGRSPVYLQIMTKPAFVDEVNCFVEHTCRAS